VSYCTKADILKQLDEVILIQLTDDLDAGAVDDSIVTSAIADADAEIDSYCGVSYDVPFDPVPRIILKHSVDISIYRLYDRRQGAPENIRKRYDDVIRFLKDVAKGIASLGGDAPEETTSDEATVTSQDRIFSRDSLKDF
jgi:phage gp36-like protein